MTVSSTTTSKEQEQQEKKVSVDFFHIDMIPDAMDKMKWQVKHSTGGDFIVLSDVLCLEPLPKDKVIVL